MLKTSNGSHFNSLYLCKGSTITLVLSLDPESFDPSIADLLLSMFGWWPRTRVLPEAFVIVLDFVMRDFGGVDPEIYNFGIC